jgi:2',3'-cyclic-nucleotide 2'-phosphodiesterase
MKVLYVGDVMAEPGQKIVTRLLPEIKAEHEVDFCIIQAENSDPEGHGPGRQEIEVLKKAGGDFFTGGNHSMRGRRSAELYADEAAPIIRPANLVGAAGRGWKIVDTAFGKVLIVSMLGQMVGSQKLEVTNPVETVDKILEETKGEKLAARIINFHGDYSSEKRVFGYYLDGRFSAVIGDHWHGNR